MDERRHSKRSHICKMATIECRDVRFDCLIRNVSSDGARLHIRSLVRIPDSFILYLTPKKGARRCQVIWKKDGECGVQFT
jgi:hypothetical protein